MLKAWVSSQVMSIQSQIATVFHHEIQYHITGHLSSFIQLPKAVMLDKFSANMENGKRKKIRARKLIYFGGRKATLSIWDKYRPGAPLLL